jgi:hypothetical protein
MTDYNDLEKLTKDVVRYTAPENGIAIFKSAPKNIIVSPACAIQMNDDTIIQLPLRKGDVVKSLFPVDLFTFIPAQEYLEYTNV